MTKYKTEELKCWPKAKELRLKHYRDYAEAHEKGGLRWAGGGWALDAVPKGLGDDIYPLAGEPYGASVSMSPISEEALAAIEKIGYAHDVCAYCRNYLGSILINKYAFGGPFPKPDFLWQTHMCCTHSKWYQVAGEMEGNVPLFIVDMSVGPPPPFGVLSDHKIKYVVDQILDGIEWMQEITKRTFDVEKYIDAVMYDMKSTHYWAKTCELNQAVPAPLDERTMFSLYVLASIHRSSKEVADFYIELYEEVKDRVDRRVAAVPVEQCRIMTDSQPPWAFLEIWKYLSKVYGAISIGSLYTFGLEGIFEMKDGNFVPKEMLERPTNLEEACRVLAEWNLYRPQWSHFYHADYKSEMMLAIARGWKVDGVLLHLNRGCEGSSLGVPENRLALLNAGIPTIVFEGSMADPRDLDEAGTKKRLDAFMDLLGVKKLN
ncbi:MAG: benzoyl-CoA reductase, bzd-type, subunit O [Deltaproteobacteria bacterium]|nr:MAG: benzoyl-CoA reductase, bzd-type, subunit O [Deltaproteobacteria bacterium]